MKEVKTLVEVDERDVVMHQTLQYLVEGFSKKSAALLNGSYGKLIEATLNDELGVFKAARLIAIELLKDEIKLLEEEIKMLEGE